MGERTSTLWNFLFGGVGGRSGKEQTVTSWSAVEVLRRMVSTTEGSAIESQRTRPLDIRNPSHSSIRLEVVI